MGHVFVVTATNLKNIPNSNEPIKLKVKNVRLSNKSIPNFEVSNMSMEQFKQAIGSKFKMLGNHYPQIHQY